VAALFLAVTPSAQTNSAAAMLRIAMDKAQVDGDLNGAIRLYQAIVDKFAKTDRASVATALVKMAECYQKLGDAQTRKIYERIVRDFADQGEAVAIARARLASAPSNTLTRRLVCTDCGDYEANTSVDGRWIAFTDWDSGDVAIRDLSTGQVKRLMAKAESNKDPENFAESPVMSPDLRQVAYIWQPGSVGNHPPSQLRITTNELGGKTRVLLNSNSPRGFYEPLGWSGDGKSILTLVGTSVRSDLQDRTLELAWVSMVEGGVRTIKSLQSRLGITSVDPKLSPDGRFIGYAALATNPSKRPLAPTDPTDTHIYVLAADGSSETEVVKTAGRNKSPIWTPDGKHLLFLSDRSGSLGLWSIPIENGKAAGEPSLVTSNLGPGFAWPLGVTRSGSYYYVVEPDRMEQISVADVQSGPRRTAETFVGIRAAWSPDGKAIAFKRHHPGGDAFDLVVHTLASGEEKTFPTSLGEISPGWVEWFHDGKSILVTFGTNRRFDGAYRVDLQTGDYKQVLDAAHGFGPAALSLDDKTLYGVRGGGIVAIDLATQTVREIVGGLTTQERTALALSPDGRAIAIFRTDIQARKTMLASVDVDGSNFRELTTLDFGRYTYYGGMLAWSRDGRAILFIQPGEDKSQVMRIPAQGGTPEFTGIDAEGTIQSMDLNRDGSRIALGSIPKFVPELWALDNVVSALK
jgi:Tol biopolymer transport system component